MLSTTLIPYVSFWIHISMVTAVSDTAASIGVVLPIGEVNLNRSVDMAISSLMRTQNPTGTTKIFQINVNRYYLTDRHDAAGTIEAVLQSVRAGDSLVVVATSPYTVRLAHSMLQTTGSSAILSGLHSSAVLPEPHLPNSPFIKDHSNEGESEDSQIIYHPRYSGGDFPHVLSSLMSHYNWVSLAIIIDQHVGYPYSIPKLLSVAIEHKWAVSVIEYVSIKSTESDLLKLLLSIRNKGVRIVYVDTLTVTARKLFDIGLANHMMYGGWAWIVSDNIVSQSGLFNPCFGAPQHLWGIVGVREKLRPSPAYEKMVSEWDQQAEHSCPCLKIGSDLEPSWLHDSILLAGAALHQCMQDGCHLPRLRRQGDNATATCDITSLLSLDGQTNGSSLLPYLRPGGVDINSQMLLPDENSAGDEQYEIVNLQNGVWTVIGDWSNHTLSIDPAMVTFTGRRREIPKDTSEDVSGKFFRVVTLVDEPFMRKKSSGPGGSSLADQYEGLCMDLLIELSARLGFNYSLVEVADGQYGVWQETTKSWTGLVGDLVDRRADLVIASLSITYEREKSVAFTKPYMDYGTTILMSVGTPTSSVFAFLEPFSPDLWYAVGGAIAACAMAVYLLSRFSPYTGRSNEGEEGDTSPQFTLAGSFWFVWASLMDQGSDLVPKSVSSRIVTGVFWFVTFILSASYTANLTAFLTVTRLSSDIKSIESLAAQTAVEYGTLKGSQISMFLDDSKLPLYTRMYDFMSVHDRMVTTTQEGIDRVRASDVTGKPYAFLFDNHMLDYAAKNEPCNTYTISRLFNKGGYGIAFRQGSPYTAAFTLAILRLRQEGFIEKLIQKWISGPCMPGQTVNTNQGGSQLTLQAMVGVFYLFGAALCVAILAICLEVIYSKCTRKPPLGKSSVCYTIGRPLRYLVGTKQHTHSSPHNNRSQLPKGQGDIGMTTQSFLTDEHSTGVRSYDVNLGFNGRLSRDRLSSNQHTEAVVVSKNGMQANPY